MSQHFKLTSKEFNDNDAIFGILEIKAGQVVGKNYQELSEFLKKRHRRLILTYHPDKGEKGDAEKFREVHKAHGILQDCIKPLESGNPCVKANIHEKSDAQSSNWCLTKQEFHYRRKLFEKLKIAEKDVVGKSSEELLLNVFGISGSTLKRDKEYYEKYGINSDYKFDIRNSDKEKEKLYRKLYDYLFPHDIFLLNRNMDIIQKDKVELTNRIIEERDLWVQDIAQNPRIKHAFSITTYSVLAVGYYLSWWVLPCYIANVAILYGLLKYHETQYKNKKISIDEYINRTNYVYYYSEYFVKYSLCALSIYLLTTNFISFGLTVINLNLSVYLALGILIEIFLCHFSKGCEIYADKNTRNLLEEDPEDRVQKETDLLKWYDPRLLLMPIFLLLVEICFGKVASELAERNLDEAGTNVFDVKTEQPAKPKGIEFTQQDIIGTA